MAAKVDVPLALSDLDACHKLPAAKGPAKIVVKFVSRFKRDAFFPNVRTAKLSHSACGWPAVDGADKAIFVTDHLSPDTARLFAAAR